MDFNEQFFDKIEDYLKGKLPMEEVAAFEKEIANDAALAEMVEMHRFEQEGMEYLVEKDLVQKLQDWKTKPPTGNGKKNNHGPFWKYGFVFLLIIALITIFFWNKDTGSSDNQIPDTEVSEPAVKPDQTPPQNPDPVIQESEEEIESPKKIREIANTNEETKKPAVPKTDPVEPPQNNYLALAEDLAINNYSIPENLNSGLRKTDSEEIENVLSAGLKAFSEDNMVQAIEELSKIDSLKNPNEYGQAQEFLAHAYFKTRQYDEAAAIFQGIVSISKMTGLDRAEWYLLLSLIPDFKNQKTEIYRLLDKMVDPDSYHNYAESAIKLKPELEKIDN